MNRRRYRFQPDDEPYAWNKAAQSVYDHLLKNKYVIIKAAPGEGKTATAKAVMKKYGENHHGCDLIELNEVEDFDKAVDCTIDTLVIVDDALGKDTSDRDQYRRTFDRRGHYWETLDACIQCGEVKALICVRTNILNEAWTGLLRYKLYREENVIEIDAGDLKLTKSNKRDILEKHCEYREISFCPDEKDCNHQDEVIMREKLPVRISEAMAQQIVETTPLIGYPKAVGLFTHDRRYLKLGLDFFKNPQDILMKEIYKFREHNESAEAHFGILLYMLLNNGEIDKHNMEEELVEQVKKETSMKSSLHRIYAWGALDDMENRFVVKDDKDVYTFKHETAREAVAICYCEDFPKYAFKVVDFAIIQKYVKSTYRKKIEHEVCIPVYPNSYPYLVERFLTERPLWQCVNNHMMDEVKFVDAFFKIVNEKKEYSDLVQKSCGSRRGMFTKACIYGKLILLDKMWENFSKRMMPYVYESLSCAARNDQVDVVAWLLARGTKLSDEQLATPISESCRYGSFGSLKLILEFRERIDVEKLIKGLYQACFGGHAEIITYILTSRPDFTLDHKREAMSWAVIGGHVDALDCVFSSSSELANHEYMSVTKYNTTIPFIHMAAFFGRSAIFEKLLNSGMLCDVHDSKVTVLQSAMFGFKNPAADFESVSSYTLMKTDLFGSYTSGMYDAYKRFPPASEYCQIMEYIIDHPEREDNSGIDMKLDKCQNTLVHYCVLNNTLSLLEKLIEHHPELIFIPNEQGTVPTQLAVFLGRSELVPSFLALGVQKVPGGLKSLKQLLFEGRLNSGCSYENESEKPGILNCLEDKHLNVYFGSKDDFDLIQKAMC